MKKHIKKSLTLCITAILMLSFIMTAYAQTNKSSDDNEIKMYKTANSVRIYASPRSALVSSIELDLTKVNSSTLKLYSEINCHVEMEKIYMSVSLQKLENDSWKSINTEDFEWLKTDYPNTALTIASASYKVGSLSAGEYRIRSSFAVSELNGSGHESRTSTSSGMSLP